MMVCNEIRKNRRAISPAITSIILIGIAVAAGIGGYTVYTSTANTASLKGAVTVESLSIIKQSDGQEYISITIKNSGNKEFVSSSANLQIDSDLVTQGIQPFSVIFEPSTLNPGQTASAMSRLIDTGGNPIVSHNMGDVLPVEILVMTSDGSTIRELASGMIRLS